GTPESDTVCETCSKGMFSNETSANAECQRHMDCNKLGVRVAYEGNSVHDAVCQENREGSTETCEIDVSLCEEALFRFSIDLPANWLTVIVQRLPGTIVKSEQIEWIKQNHDAQEQVFHLFKLWKNQNREHDSVKRLIQDVEVCEKGVTKHIRHLNMTAKHLTALMQSLPGKKIGEDDVESTLKMCDEPKQILKLLNLWRIKNGGNTIKGLELLKTKKLPTTLRRRVKKLVRFLNSVAMFTLYQKLLLEIIGYQAQPAKLACL
ncbi:hypothetical protein FKM82_023809, partial [Ascaphus truei]